MIIIKYSLFAILATACNLTFQYLSLILYSEDNSLYIAMLVGTIAGLVSKYFMDKHYIFNQKAQCKKQDSQQFILYSMTGVLTTCFFWGTELSFNAIFDSSLAKYIGAIIGLSVGYFIKYQLDKKYVFKEGGL